MYYHYYYRFIGRRRCRSPGRFVQAEFHRVDMLHYIEGRTKCFFQGGANSFGVITEQSFKQGGGA